MYIKKRIIIIWSAVLIIAASALTIVAVNPFGISNIDDFLRFTQIGKLIRSEYYEDVSGEDYANGAIAGFAYASGDNYTGYLYGDTAKEYLEDSTGAYDGIGVSITADEEDNTIEIVSVMQGTPAEAAGLKVGDKILKIDGAQYNGEQIDEASRVMRGLDGTTVDIEVRRASTDVVETMTVERKHIETDSVTSKMLDGNIGYIAISQFIDKTDDDFKTEFDALKAEGMTSLVLDLRNNPGGYVESAVAIASNFVESGKTVAYTLNKAGDRVDYTAEGDTTEIPIAILINGNSASASELLTGCLKDYGLAYVIGEQSFGKGIVQSVYTFSNESVLSVTTDRYYTPNGVCIHGSGISPDEVIPMDKDKYARINSLTIDEDDQLLAAMNYLKNLT
ncbi:MAG TPA: S41 family peptidase [Firmicutes bacterium]|nr:S41 family peptidase [Bacillota bacterium]